jgi:hypothetical protein
MPQRPGLWRRDSTQLLPKLPERFAEGIARARRDRFDGHRVLNVRPDPIDFRDCPYEPSLVAVQAMLGPPEGWPADMIRNQGSEGACTGHALAAVIDVQNAKRLAGLVQPEALGIPRRASARMLYEMARAHDDLPNDRLPGSSLRGALKGFFHNGVCGEDEAPYIPHEPAWQLEVGMAKSARRCGLGAYFRLRPVLYEYHAALNEVGCVLCSAMLHDGWQAAKVKQANGRIALPESEPSWPAPMPSRSSPTTPTALWCSTRGGIAGACSRAGRAWRTGTTTTGSVMSSTRGYCGSRYRRQPAFI